MERLAAALAGCGRRIGVVDAGEPEHDVVPDMPVGDVMEVATSMCARLYGCRGTWIRR